MRVFLTGGAGYIGSIMAEYLLQQGCQVTVYDSLVTGHRQAVPQGARFIHADLADRDRLRQALAEGYDAVMHFAAFIQAGESMREPGKYFQNNVVNSLYLLEAVVEAGVPVMLFSSTAAVYVPKATPLREDDPIGPVNVYGQTKRMVEEMLTWYHRVHGLRVGILRYFNAAGALPHRGEDHPNESHLIPLVLQVALGKREAIYIYGTDYPTPDGTCIRDFIHVLDLVEAHWLVLQALREGADFLLYNLGNGQGYSVREVIETARRVTGHPIPAVEAPRRPGDAPYLVASSEKARRELGWRPRFPRLEDIIASAWEWHRTHPNGYRDR